MGDPIDNRPLWPPRQMVFLGRAARAERMNPYSIASIPPERRRGDAARLPKASQSGGDHVPVHAVSATCHRRPVSTSVFTEKNCKTFCGSLHGGKGRNPLGLKGNGAV